MSVQYQYLDDDIQAESQSVSSDEEITLARCDGRPGALGGNARRSDNINVQLANDLIPTTLSVIHTVIGAILVLLGLTQIFFIPLLTDWSTDASWEMDLNKSNCYGIGLFAGIMMLLSGMLQLRVVYYKSINNVIVSELYSLLEITALSAILVVVIISFAAHWTTINSTYSLSRVKFGVHVIVSICLVVSYVLVIVTFSLNFQRVFCAEVQLCKKCLHCCFPCWCPQAVTFVSLHNSTTPHSDRPPSLPV